VIRVETVEPPHPLDSVNGRGVVRLRDTACQERMVEVAVTQDAHVAMLAVRVALLPDGGDVDQTPSSSRSASLLAGGHR
jgi:hypothetical protein